MQQLPIIFFTKNKKARGFGVMAYALAALALMVVVTTMSVYSSQRSTNSLSESQMLISLRSQINTISSQLLNCGLNSPGNPYTLTGTSAFFNDLADSGWIAKATMPGHIPPASMTDETNVLAMRLASDIECPGLRALNCDADNENTACANSTIWNVNGASVPTQLSGFSEWGYHSGPEGIYLNIRAVPTTAEARALEKLAANPGGQIFVYCPASGAGIPAGQIGGPNEAQYLARASDMLFAILEWHDPELGAGGANPIEDAADLLCP